MAPAVYSGHGMAYNAVMFVRPLRYFAHAGKLSSRVGRSALVILWLSLAMLAVSCQQAGSNAPVLPTAIIAEGEPASAVPAPATGLVAPAPTVTTAVAETMTPSTTTPSAVTARCDQPFFFEPAPDACPVGPPIPSAAAEQPFEGGVMVWLEERDAIIVFFPDGRWQQFEDTWTEGEPENDPTIVPPDGRFQPIRGFGKLWRETPGLREELGWALGVELGFESMLQEQAPTDDQPALTYLLTYNGQVFALVLRDLDQGDWVMAADNR